MTIAAGKSAGSADSTSPSADRPPAEAAIATTSNAGLRGSDTVPRSSARAIFCFGHRRRPERSAGLLSAPSLAISLTLPCLFRRRTPLHDELLSPDRETDRS